MAELVEATVCGIFVFALITQSSRRFVEMMAFLSSQRNIIDVLESTRIFNAIEIMCLRLRSGTEMRIENVPSTGSGTEMRIENVPSTTLRHRV